MSSGDIAAALARADSVLRRKPATGLHEDAPATARWQGGLRVVASHPEGHEVATDMPREFGGAGALVTPGWLFRAGLAACAATSIRMAAATAGIELVVLEVRAASRSDARGLLGIAGADGERVPAAPLELGLDVRIAAAGADAARLQALVEDALLHSPVPDAVRCAHPLGLRIDVLPP